MTSRMTSTRPVLHCCETWHVLAAHGEPIENRPRESATWEAMARLTDELIHPLEEEFGVVTLTYGFAGPELTKAVKARAAALERMPNITPERDQHAGHELNTRGTRICKRDGFAVDLRVPGQSSFEVAAWIEENLRFDRMYLYAPEKPFHLSWAPDPVRQVIQMIPRGGGLLRPRTLHKPIREMLSEGSLS